MENLRKEELRIGNLVSYKNADYNICVVDAIYTTHFKARNIDTGIDYGDSLRTNYKPIPLTEKWLIDFGCEVFEFDHKENQYWLGERLFVIRDGIFYDYGSDLKLLYVHTFQNFIFIMSQKNLKLDSKE